MKTTNIKCNFAQVFAKFNSVEEIKEVANHICAQVKEAFEARKKELEDNDWIGVEDIVEIVEEQKETKKEAKKATKKEDKKDSMMKRAKEMAEKMRCESKKEDKPKKEGKKESKKETKAEPKKEDTSDLILVTDTASIKKLGLTFSKYNDKCYVLRGETKPLRKVLKEEFKGVYNRCLTGGEGWVIASKYAQDCAKALGLKCSA